MPEFIPLTERAGAKRLKRMRIQREVTYLTNVWESMSGCSSIGDGSFTEWLPRIIRSRINRPFPSPFRSRKRPIAPSNPHAFVDAPTDSRFRPAPTNDKSETSVAPHVPVLPVRGISE